MNRLAPHGGCNWEGCTECFPDQKPKGMEEILNDLIMLNETELSRIELLLVGMEDSPDRDILEMMKAQQSKHVHWLKGTKHGISEGYI